MRPITRIIPAATLAAALCLSEPAHAATYTIANGDVNGFRAAVAAANASTGPDIIVLATHGLYTLVASEPGASGLPAVTSHITIVGNNSRIERSTAAGTPGFRIFVVAQGGDLTLRNVIVRNGFSSPNSGMVGSGNGGAVFNRGTLTIIDSTLTANSAHFGAGVMNLGGRVTVRNSTISHNTATGVGGGGGGVASYHAYGTWPEIKIVSSTLFENSAPPGAGDALLIFGGELTLRGSVLASPSQGGGTACKFSEFSSPPVSLGHNIASDMSCGLNGPGDMPATNPTLGPLTPFGTASMVTHPPLNGSPAINAVLLAACVDETGATLGFDQRGTNRPIGGGCDVGAHESRWGHAIRLSRTVGPADVALGDFGVLQEVHLPPRSTAHSVALSGGHGRGLSQGHDRRGSEVHARRLSELHDRRLSEAHDRRVSDAHDRRLSELHDRRLSEAHDPRRSEAHDPRLSEIHDPRRSEAHDPRRSEAHDPRRSEAHDPRRSESHDPRLSAAHDDRRSELHDPRRSAAGSAGP